MTHCPNGSDARRMHALCVERAFAPRCLDLSCDDGPGRLLCVHARVSACGCLRTRTVCVLFLLFCACALVDAVLTSGRTWVQAINKASGGSDSSAEGNEGGEGEKK